MNDHTEFYILAAGVLGAAFGFMVCALVSSNRIRRANLEGYIEAIRFQEALQKEVGR